VEVGASEEWTIGLQIRSKNQIEAARGGDMKAKTILVLVMFLALRVAAQEAPKSQTQCKFSDGKTIKITDSSKPAGSARLSTDGILATVKGMTVPAGDYIVLPAWDSHNKWTLTMNKQNGKDGSLPLSMSATTPAPPIDNPIWFDSTGGSCTLHWHLEKSNTLLSLEFAEPNTDMPLLQ
jgi:hypothetical protein